MKNRHSMTIFTVVSMGVGAMVGAGIVALLSTYSYAKLGAKYPSAGGPVEFLVRGFGDNVLRFRKY